MTEKPKPFKVSYIPAPSVSRYLGMLTEYIDADGTRTISGVLGDERVTLTRDRDRAGYAGRWRVTFQHINRKARKA